MRVPPPIPPKIAAYLRDLINYNWADEEADYQDDPADDHVFVGLRAIDEWMTTIPPTVPDLGATFDHDGHRYVVTSWLKRHPQPRATARRVGPDHSPLVFCTREEAEYVGGSGIAGCLLRVGDVHVTGHATWSPELLDHHRTTAALVVGQEAV